MPGTADTIIQEQSSFRGTVRKVIEEALKSAGIEVASIEIEPSPAIEKLRIWIVSDEFRRFNLAERQNIVWRVLNQRFQLADLARISMIFTLTTEERGEEDSESLEGVVVNGIHGLKCEVVREVDLGYGYAGHGTSQTCLFIVSPHNESSFALYVSYSELLLVARGWSSLERWADARTRVREFVQTTSLQDIEREADLGGWEKVADGWELWVRTA